MQRLYEQANKQMTLDKIMLNPIWRLCKLYHYIFILKIDIWVAHQNRKICY